MNNFIQANAAGEALVNICHSAALKAGWWHYSNGGGSQDLKQEVKLNTFFGKALVAQKLALIHSEISEAMEGHRKNMMDDHLPSRKMIEVELADAVIRIADLAGALGLDLGGAIAEKMEYNEQRPDHKPENRVKEGGKAY